MRIAYDPPDPPSAERIIRQLEKTMLSAEQRGALPLAVRLAADASSLLKKVDDTRGAASFAERAVDYVEIAPAESLPIPPSIAVQAYRKSALNQLSLGKTERARNLLLKAQRLVDDTVPLQVVADVHWSSSVLAKRLHDPTGALDHALRAWDHYYSRGPSLERSRLRIEIAQHAMALAQLARSMDAFTSEYEYLALAQEHIYNSRPRSRSKYAPDVELNHLIVYARFSRLTCRQDDRLSLLEDVERRAFNLDSRITRGLALSEMGDELAALGHLDSARKRRHQAVNILSRSPAPGLALPIKHALMVDEEFRIRQVAAVIGQARSLPRWEL